VLGSLSVFSLRLAIALGVLIVTLTAAPALAAEPSVSPGPSAAPSPIFIDPLDPRAGSGANRVGAPWVALITVIAIGGAAAATTALYVRVTRRR
jgi:hypothetical protein